MRYVRVNDHDYVLVDNTASARVILLAWLFQKRKQVDWAPWQVLLLNANGTATVLAPDDIPSGYADFEIIEVSDNA